VAVNNTDIESIVMERQKCITFGVIFEIKMFFLIFILRRLS